MLATLLASAALLAAPFPETIPVPPGSNPEGIATGKGTTFYVGSRANGSVYSGSLRTGEGAILVPAQTGREAYGLKQRGGKLYVAGGPTGAIYVYDARTGANVDSEQLFARGGGFINDVTVTREAAYFTDSQNPVLYVYDRSSGMTSTLQLGGDYVHQPGFNANGIAATPNGKRLIIVQSNTGFLFSVNPKTGAATKIEAPSMTMGDGILLRGKTLYVVRNRLELVEVLRLRDHFTRATQKATLTDEDFDIPTTIARNGSRLYVVNARFGNENDPAATYDVVKVG
jgi:hypothetical protein